MNEAGKMKYGFGSYPFFLAGIVFFFIIDGYSNFINLIPVQDMILYSAYWLLIAYVLLYISNLKFRSVQKAGLFSAFLIAAYLFFGDIKSGLAVIPFLDRFSVVCVILVCLAFFIFRFLSKSKNNFFRTATYLNILFLTLITVDICRIFFGTPAHAAPSNKTENLPVLPSGVRRPDVYLIILDEYAGNPVLKKHFDFDNSVFLNSLKSRSFFVSSNSISNYSSTPLSVASMFEMDYLQWADKGKAVTVEDYSEAEKTMENSFLLSSLKHHGYDFYNHSIFNIGDKPSAFDPELLPTNLKLITSKTLGNQFRKNILALGSLPVHFLLLSVFFVLHGVNENFRYLSFSVSAAVAGAVLLLFMLPSMITRDNRGVAANMNLLTTMLLGGFWHGASWNFIIWGALHG
ncbi:MAG: hypothetical protein EOO04_24595, partial [Chitinophagaceae bacterium]